MLAHMLDMAREHLGGLLPAAAVVTVPAHFGEQQRAATIAAARMAGIQQVRAHGLGIRA